MCHPACSYVRVDSNQITGGRITPGDKSESPRPPQRTLNDPYLKPEVSPSFSRRQPPRSWRSPSAKPFVLNETPECSATILAVGSLRLPFSRKPPRNPSMLRPSGHAMWNFNQHHRVASTVR